MLFLSLVGEDLKHLFSISEFTFFVGHLFFSGSESGLVKLAGNREFSHVCAGLGKLGGKTPEIVVTGLFGFIMSALGVRELVFEAHLDGSHAGD